MMTKIEKKERNFCLFLKIVKIWILCSKRRLIDHHLDQHFHHRHHLLDHHHLDDVVDDRDDDDVPIVQCFLQ